MTNSVSKLGLEKEKHNSKYETVGFPINYIYNYYVKVQNIKILYVRY